MDFFPTLQSPVPMPPEKRKVKHWNSCLFETTLTKQRGDAVRRGPFSPHLVSVSWPLQSSWAPSRIHQITKFCSRGRRIPFRPKESTECMGKGGGGILFLILKHLFLDENKLKHFEEVLYSFACRH